MSEKRPLVKGGRPRGTLGVLTLHVVRLQARGAPIWGAALGLYAAALVASFTTFDPEQMAG